MSVVEKLKMQSPDRLACNLQTIAELFPGCVTQAAGRDGKTVRKIDFDLLRQALSGEIVEGPRERYELNWPGKRDAMLASLAPIAKTLRPCRDESVHFDTTRNLFVEGDNLDALKLLQASYGGRVQMIYIDPPYNRGQDLIYRDNFHVDARSYRRRSRGSAASDVARESDEAIHGRFHSDWLSMIFPRLRLAHQLLAPEGLFCVSIDDRELANLKHLLDEIFGEENYVNTVSVLAKVGAGVSGGGEDKRLKKNIEYLLLYARDVNALNVVSQIHTTRPLMNVISQMRASGESWKYTSIMLQRGPRTHVCDIEDGNGDPIQIFRRTLVQRGTVRSVMEEEGLSEAETYRKYFSSIFSDTNAQTSIRDRVREAVGELSPRELLEVQYVPRSGKNKGKRVTHSYIGRTVRRVIWLSDTAELVSEEIIKKDRLGTFWDNFDYNNVGKEGGIPYPDGKKPIDLLRTCIRLYQQNDGIFVDFFAGSGSFGHAVLRQNREDQGKRRFLLVQMPEELNTSQARFQAAVSCYRAIGIEANASEVSKERLRRAGSEIASQSDGAEGNLDVGFRVLKIDSSNMNDAFYQPEDSTEGCRAEASDTIKPGRTGEDLLFQIMLDCGLDLGLPIASRVIAGTEVHFVGDNTLAACFDPDLPSEVVRQIASRQPLRAIFHDQCFHQDKGKVDIEKVFAELSPATRLSRL